MRDLTTWQAAAAGKGWMAELGGASIAVNCASSTSRWQFARPDSTEEVAVTEPIDSKIASE